MIKKNCSNFTKNILQMFFLFFIVCAALMVAIAPSFSEVRSEIRNGHLVFFDDADSTISTIDVMAPVKFLQDFILPQGVINDPTEALGLYFAAVNSGTITSVASVPGGVGRMTTGAADDDDCELSTELVWYPGKFCSMEARVRVNDPTVGLNVGFTDTSEEGADNLAFEYATTTLTTNASNAALLFADFDATSNYIRAASVKANTDKTIFTSDTLFAEDVWHVYRVDINEDGDIAYWLDGENIGNQTAGITTTTYLCAYIGVINREGTAQTIDVDKLIVWQSN